MYKGSLESITSVLSVKNWICFCFIMQNYNYKKSILSRKLKENDDAIPSLTEGIISIYTVKKTKMS